MIDLTYAQIQEFLNQADLKQLTPLRITILRNIVLEPMEPYLRFLAYQMGYRAEISFGQYDMVYQEAVGGREDLVNQNTDCVLIFLALETLSPDIMNDITEISPERIQSEVTRLKEYFYAILEGIRGQTSAMILWHSFELPTHPDFGIWDSQTESGQVAVIRRLNNELQSLLRQQPNTYFVDLNLCLARVGAQRYYDRRYWHISRAPYSNEGLKEIAFEDLKFIRALKGKNKKCIVLDCDGTLWGGIIGEDGLNGIRIGKTYPGSGYYEFQQQIVKLYHRGVIVALCSKNNEEDVWEAFRKHPDMVLKEEHVATAQINWQDKVTNLKQLALDLNIGLDSLVVFDDSEFEVNLVRELLPEVEVIHLPPNKSSEYKDILAKCGLFDTLTISEEDKERGGMYRAEANRKKIQAEYKDIVSYLRSLEMEVEITFANDFNIPRIAQITQKTNQFNLTTKRYSESHIQSYAQREDSDVLCLRIKDKFGDLGIVGTSILKYETGKAIFDTFLLSCRALGRGVENVLIVQALKLARLRGSNVAVGEYFATAKNGQVEDFYDKQGFKTVAEGNNVKRSIIDLEGFDRKEPDFFKRIDSDIDKIVRQRKIDGHK